MRIGETTEKNGTEYIAVAYNERPAEFFPVEEDDPQCRLCALMPNYCGMKDECHGTPAFVFVRRKYLEAMNTLLATF